ncbi:MAG: hypothetical protein HN633_11975 [Candidatus Marinimicrobia bacterium]|nr:hypothetical protein [Candidatus Neomarinimicrobiota bacterium]
MKISLILLMSLMTSLFAQNLKDIPDSLKQDLGTYFPSKSNIPGDEVVNIDESLYSRFRVPEFSYRQLQLGSDNLFSFAMSGGASDIALNFQADYSSFTQSTYNTFSYGVIPVFDLVKQSEADVFSAFQAAIPFDLSQYFAQDYSGFHAFTSGDFKLAKVGDADLLSPLGLTLGAGYGRITSVRPIARAVALATEIGGEITADQLIQIATIITRRNDGYYSKTYKSDDNIFYYNELAEALNAPTQTMRIQQVMENPAFANISDRRIGWHVRSGFSHTLFSDDSTLQSKLVFSAEYARPIGLDRQLMLGFQVAKPENGDSEIKLVGNYSIDHSITWVSNLQLNYDSDAMDIELSTTKVLINKISGRASLGATQPAEGDFGLTFLLHFVYFAF